MFLISKKNNKIDNTSIEKKSRADTNSYEQKKDMKNLSNLLDNKCTKQ